MGRFDSITKLTTVKRAKKNRVTGWNPWGGYGRGYENPAALVAAIMDPAHALAARIQFEGGVRAEGVGFPRSPFSRRRLTQDDLIGIVSDPFFGDGRLVGAIETTEKGGLRSKHYITVETYRQVETYLCIHGFLGGEYVDYLKSIRHAARKTNQHLGWRGTHGLKHAFAHQFLKEAAAAGKKLNETLIEISRRCSHRRGDVAPTYYTGKR